MMEGATMGTLLIIVRVACWLSGETGCEAFA
jgi:hypothetical protein